MDGSEQFMPSLNDWHGDFQSWIDEGRNRHNAKPKRAKVTVYRTDAVVQRRGWTPKCAGTISERGRIGAAPSWRSLQALIFRLNNSDVPMRSMLTLTMSPLCHDLCYPWQHRKVFANAIQRLRDTGVKNWCWVREFQKNGSVHWHVFTELTVGEGGEVNQDLSQDWSRYWAAAYWDHEIEINPDTICPSLHKACKISRRKMESKSWDGFTGCCRFEQLKTEAAGLYAAKEGAKRFQKKAPGEWANEGGAWWRCNRDLKCTPLYDTYVNATNLASTKIATPNGEVDVAFKLQQSLGLKLLKKT